MSTTPTDPTAAAEMLPPMLPEDAGPRTKTGRLARLSRPVRSVILAVIGLVVVLVVADLFNAYRDFQISQIAAYVVVVSGLTVLTGLNGQISLGHGALMAVGAYTTAIFLIHTTLPLIVILALSVISGAVVGAAAGAVAARLRGPYLAGATLTLAVALPNVPRTYHYFGGGQGLTINPPLSPGWLGTNYSIERWGADICLVGAVITLLVLTNLTGSRYGRQFKAVRDDEIAASLAGIPVARTQILAFMVSAACAGLGGGLLALVIPTVGPDGFPLTLSIQLLVAIVIGGMGSLTGSVIGAIIIVLLPTWATDIANGVGFSPQIGANLSLAIFGSVLILAMLIFPGGLVGGVRRAGRVLAARQRPGGLGHKLLGGTPR
jgi:branched-chain amino acid transport system permease protein